MTIHIKKTVNIVMLAQIICVLFLGIINSYIPTTSTLNYLLDILSIVLALCLLINGFRECKTESFLLLIFIIYEIISIIWGDRNWYYAISQARRYISSFLVFYAGTKYLSNDYLEKGINLFLVAQGINVLLTIYQNIVMKLHPDFCNGIFGFSDYNNASQGTLSLLISLIAMVYYVDRKWSARKAIYAIGSSCIICAFSEVKVYYILLIISFLCIIILRTNDRVKRRKIIKVIVIISLLLYFAYKILEEIFPYNLETFFNLSKYIMYEQYGARGRAGRLSTISYIFNTEFHGKLINTLFGVGLGGVTVKYVYTIGKIFASSGAVGICLLLLFFLVLGTKCFKALKTNSESLICFVLVLMLIIMLFLWNTLFTKNCFVIFWILSSCDKQFNSCT